MYRVSPGPWVKVAVNACSRVLIPSLSLQLFSAFHTASDEKLEGETGTRLVEASTMTWLKVRK